MEEENTQNPLVARSETETIPVYGVNLSIENRLLGYVFAPTDTDLLIFLNKKIRNEPLPHDGIKEVKVYDHSPQFLAENYPPLKEKVLYFFTRRESKYLRGTRPNRQTKGNGYWRSTCQFPITNNGETIGSKATLVFYQGKPSKAEKTNWIMHEYKVKGTDDKEFDDYVLCRIYEREVKPSKNQKETADNRELANVDCPTHLLPTQSGPVIGNVEGMTDPKELLINRSEDHCIATVSSFEVDGEVSDPLMESRITNSEEDEASLVAYWKQSKVHLPVSLHETETIPVYDVNLSIEDRLLGYLFAPTDTELLIHFLYKKLMNQPMPHDGIKEVKVYDHSPQFLAALQEIAPFVTLKFVTISAIFRYNSIW